MTGIAEAEALFGSASRGDGDNLSDRDFLIVDSNIDLLNSRKVELESQGFSVASYTWKKLIALSKSKALFLQHLKLESQILRDEKNRLAALLGAYAPKQNYSEEISQNSYLASVASTFPASSQGALWASDVLYVCFRNYGVLYLADRRRYTFAFGAILSDLIMLGCITDSQAGAITKLRWMKSLYRHGHQLSYSKASKILREAAASLPPGVFPSKYDAAGPADILASASSLPLTATAYHRLRNLEKLYLALAEATPDRLSDPKLELLQRWISDPRSYASFAVANESNLVEILRAESATLGQIKQTARIGGA